jgi:peroxiredoxin
MKKVLLILLVMLIAMPVYAWFGDGKLVVGDEIPEISLPDLQGKKLNLPDDLKGKVLLVHFFSMDCHFCDKEIMLQLEPLYQKYKVKGFVPIVVNVGEVDKKDVRWKKLTVLTYPLLVDEKGVIAQKLGVIGLPTTFVIDREGVLQKKLTGEAKIDEYEQLFTTVLQPRASYENTH